MMTGEVTVVPQCRVGLAPTASLTRRLVLSGGDGHRVVAGAVGRDHRIPFVTGGDDGVQLAQDRRGDDGLGLVGVSLLFSLVVRCRYRAS